MTQDTEEPTGEVSVMPVSATEAIERAEIDMQIATAHRYPRSIEKFKKRAISMATIDEETAASCLYRRPVGKKLNPATGKWEVEYAEGLSVRMAEIVGASYGNLRVAAMLVEQNERWVKARGVATDLESGYTAASEVIEATVDRNGNPYSERMRVVIAKSTLAKARRDATFIVVPRALAKPVETEVRRLLMGDSQTLEARRAAVIAWVSKLGIDTSRVWAALGIKGEADLGVEQLEQLTGIRTAIKDNEVGIDEAFPLPGSPGDGPTQGAASAPPAVEPETIAKLVAAFGEHEGEVNLYLRETGWIAQNETYRDLDGPKAARALKHTRSVLEQAGVKPPKK